MAEDHVGHVGHVGLVRLRRGEKPLDHEEALLVGPVEAFLVAPVPA